MKFTAATSLTFVLSSLSVTSVHAAPGPVAERAALATVYSRCTAPNTVALTFDDGPYIYTTAISNLLTQNGIKGTFFVNGNNYNCIYDQRQMTSLKQAYGAGHMIASHTWAHKDLSTLNWDQLHDEMWRVELAMGRILGVKPAFMRPPYGSYNDLVREAALVRNQSVVLWDFDSGDSTGSSPAQSEQAYTNIANQHPSTILTLNHETIQSTAQRVLPFAINALKAKGYRFVTVAECLGLQPYHSVGAPERPDSSWVC